jgi:lysophospholipase L1-like esterase
MRRFRLFTGGALLAGGLLAAVAMRQPVPAVQDRLIPVALPQDRALRVTAMGTSLTHNELWTARLGEVLSACIAHPVEVAVVARAGAAVDWALTQPGAVAATQPDVVLVEFAINDADIEDGHWMRDARALHETLLADLRAQAPQAALMLMTMSPAHGWRGWIRPWLRAHYLQYRDLAEAQDTGLIDLYPRWLALPRDARGLAEDGLHPDQQVAADVIAPAVAGVLARAMGRRCS